MSRYCRICGSPVTSDDAWVLLSPLGRFWLCPHHRKGGHFYQLAWGGYMYGNDHRAERFLVGPYPYDRSSDFQIVTGWQ